MKVLETVLEWLDGQRAAGGGSPAQAGTGPLTLLRGWVNSSQVLP